MLYNGNFSLMLNFAKLSQDGILVVFIFTFQCQSKSNAQCLKLHNESTDLSVSVDVVQ